LLNLKNGSSYGKKGNAQTIIIVVSVIAGLIGVVLSFIKPWERTVRGKAAIERLYQTKTPLQLRLDQLERWLTSHEKEASSRDAAQTERIKSLERNVYKGD